MTLLFLILAFLLFAVAGIGMAVERARWMALVAFGLAAWVLVDLWPHFGIH
jgi:hypothetical protein